MNKHTTIATNKNSSITLILRNEISRNEVKYHYFRDFAVEAREKATNRKKAVKIVAEEIERVMTQEALGMVPQGSYYSDILAEALFEVDYFAIAERILDE